MEDSREGPWGWSTMVVAAIATLAVLSVAYRASSLEGWRKRKYPPGPRGWPVFGSLLSLGRLPHQTLHKLAEEYGPIMFMHLGSVPTLVVSNSQMAEVILKTKDQIMASRPNLLISHKIFYNAASIAMAPYGPYWRYIRKVCTMEIYSSQRISQFQGMRQREVLEMLHSVLKASEQGNVVIISEFLSNLATNNVTQMMLSKSYCSANGESVSDEATTFRNIVREISILLGEFNIADYIPILKPLDLQGYNKRFDALHQKVDAFLENVLEEHRSQSLTSKRDKSEDFVDVLLAVSERNEAESLEERLSVGSIKAILIEMIAAGTETAATTLEWALAELVRHPNMLRSAQEELDLVVGKHRLVDEADIPQLKYIQAVVKEVFRLHPAPLLIPHQSMENCEIAGYHIPAGCLVLVNVWSIQKDPQVWEKPMEFDPDRYLSSKRGIDVKGNSFELLPFGSGRRNCPGMNLGLLLVQYTLAQMLHTISWALPQDQLPAALDMSECFGVVCSKAIALGLLAKPRLPRHVIYPKNPV